MKVDSVEQWPGDLIQIFLDDSRRAYAFFFRMVVIAARTWVRCILVNVRLKGRKPQNKAYPATIETLGDHLRTVRLDREMSQPQVADILNVDTDTITAWEMNRNHPTAKYAKDILKFLGYIPDIYQDQRIYKRLYLARQILGHTQKEAAKIMGCDSSNIRFIELGKRRPSGKTIKKIERYIHAALNSMEGISA